MYTVVICSECTTYVWIVDDVPDRTQCGRCQTSHQFKKLKHLYQTEDLDEARHIRAAIAADAMGERESFKQEHEKGAIDIDPGSVIDDEELLEKAGVDIEEIVAAGDLSSSSQSEIEIIREAIREQKSPSQDAVVEYAGARGVDADKVRDVLTRLTEKGEIVRRDGGLQFV